MKEALTNVDVAAVAAELSAWLVGGRFDKAYQPAKDQVLLRFRRRGAGRADVLVKLGSFITVTKRPPENPQKPSMVAQILRGTFGNGRVVGVSQIGFDRVLRFDVEKPDGVHSIVIEMFREGNMLILAPDGTIALPMRGEDYRHRKLRKGEVYIPPPAGVHPLELSRDALVEESAKARKDLVRFLALDLGFGPLWAEELCLRSGVDKNTIPADMDAEWTAVHDAIQALAKDIARNDMAPAVVYKDGEPIDAVPFQMESYAAPAHAFEEATSFQEALDVFFVGAEPDEDEEDPRRRRFAEAKAKIQRQLDQMESAMDGFTADEESERADGDALYASFQEVQGILDSLHAARATRSWQDVEQVLQKGRDAGQEAALKIPELHPHTGEAVLAIKDMDGNPRNVRVDLRQSVQENADAHYAAAKKARSRREGALKAVEDARQRMRDLESKGLDAFGAAPKKADRQSRHFWFETYRWTITPSGLLAVGGRNAAQNDAVVKKYLREGDRYVHAEIHGAPSVVVRPPDSVADIPDEDLRVACQFAACASRAWRQFGAASAYWVTASQVNKTPRSGEFVPRGAWIVHGKRNIESDLPMEWLVGVVKFKRNGQPVPPDTEDAIEKVVGGPPGGIAPFALRSVTVRPGDMDPNDAAAVLAERLGVTIEEAQAVLPNGPVSL